MAAVLLPNLLLEASGDYVMTLRFEPTGPLSTRADVQWLVRDDAVEGRDYDLERLTAFWKLTCEQDWKLCEDSQAGGIPGNTSRAPTRPTRKGSGTSSGGT